MDLIAYQYDFTACMGLDVLLGYVLAFVVKQAVRVLGPRDTPHVHFEYFVLLLLRALQERGSLLNQFLDLLMLVFLHLDDLLRHFGVFLLGVQLFVQEPRFQLQVFLF